MLRLRSRVAALSWADLIRAQVGLPRKSRWLDSRKGWRIMQTTWRKRSLNWGYALLRLHDDGYCLIRVCCLTLMH